MTNTARCGRMAAAVGGERVASARITTVCSTQAAAIYDRVALDVQAKRAGGNGHSTLLQALAWQACMAGPQPRHGYRGRLPLRKELGLAIHNGYR